MGGGTPRSAAAVESIFGSWDCPLRLGIVLLAVGDGGEPATEKPGRGLGVGEEESELRQAKARHREVLCYWGRSVSVVGAAF